VSLNQNVIRIIYTSKQLPDESERACIIHRLIRVSFDCPCERKRELLPSFTLRSLHLPDAEWCFRISWMCVGRQWYVKCARINIYTIY